MVSFLVEVKFFRFRPKTMDMVVFMVSFLRVGKKF